MRNKVLFKFLALTIVTVMLFTLFGCGKKTDSENSDSGDKSTSVVNNNDTAAQTTTQDEEVKKTKVNVTSWWDFTKTKALQELKARFEELNPDIELEFNQIGTGYADKMLTIISGGGDSVPDVIMLAMDKVPLFASKGAIVDLDKYITQEYKDSLYPMVLDACTYNGKVYAVARDVTTFVMYLNKALFEADNIPIPDDDWTVDEFLDIAKKLTKYDKNGKPIQWGYYCAKYPDTMYDWVLLNGGRYVTEDGTKSLVGTPETKKALQFIYDLTYKYKVSPTDIEIKQFGDKATAGIVAGKVAMQMGGLSYSTDFDTAEPKVEYAIAPIPTLDGKKVAHAFVNTWAIPKGAKNPDISWRVLEFFSGKEGQQIALDNNLGLPASKLVDTSAFIAKNSYYRHFIDSLSYAVPFEVYVYGSQFYEQVFKPELELLWTNQTTVDKAAAAIDEKGNKVLSGEQ
ncbi:MAG TPA: sugar ABC transporter substrate-binding protein [Tepidanaerobacter syntrophicus]|uniref:ABC transporter substrate-binding protein n=1 Tax=Tepidanaerobacter syntrophicus TaxID=224999 RepID=UPI001773427E|nr:sugar ABC transporter substrate-binding protein [Tepidanaerobacter syntrophicus]HHV83499.1 sugar ABC transporter substrate-binding protein [Tepidanaerobacter syntrophicus]